MQRIIIISNRLPVTIQKKGEVIIYSESVGGLSTGLSSIHKQSGGLWLGWPGISDEEITEAEKVEIQKVLAEKYQCIPIFLSQKEVDLFYYGFCNKTIWPLFHYFVSKADYSPKTWNVYKQVNQKFFEAASLALDAGDIIWIHDYQLMLLPKMVRDIYPDHEIGFFLHIPFPSYEIFRLLL